MKTILLALSTTRHSERTVEHALSECHKAGGRLVGLFVVDAGLADSIGRRVTDVGFLGEEPTRELRRSILDSYRRRAERRLEAIADRAGRERVDFISRIAVGGFAEECLRIIEEQGVDKVILTRAQRSDLSRFLFGSPVNDLIRLAPCAVEIIPDPGE